MQGIYNPAIVLQGIFHREIKTVIQTGMFIAALLLTGKNWSSPDVFQWLKHWYIHTMEYYSAIQGTTATVSNYILFIQKAHPKMLHNVLLFNL